MNSKIQKRPNLSSKAAEAFINGAPDATPKSTPAPARSLDTSFESGGRKKPISLTIEPNILAELDRVARGLGLSRAAAFSLAVSRFIAQEKKEG